MLGIRSADGTSTRCWREGGRTAARPGTWHHADHAAFRFITPILASCFTVYTMVWGVKNSDHPL
jgi:hypothetical protein